MWHTHNSDGAIGLYMVQASDDLTGVGTCVTWLGICDF